jgi:hypothetical protein
MLIGNTFFVSVSLSTFVLVTSSDVNGASHEI